MDEAVAVCLALPDVNRLDARGAFAAGCSRSGGTRCSPGARSCSHARVWALGVRPDYQHLALGPLLYREIVDRLADDPDIRTCGGVLDAGHQPPHQRPARGHGGPPVEGVAAVPATGRV